MTPTPATALAASLLPSHHHNVHCSIAPLFSVVERRTTPSPTATTTASAAVVNEYFVSCTVLSVRGTPRETDASFLDELFAECVGLRGSVASFIESREPEQLDELLRTLYSGLPASVRDNHTTNEALFQTALAGSLLREGVQVEVEAPLPSFKLKKADVVAKLGDVTVVFELKRVRQKDVKGNIDSLKDMERGGSGRPATQGQGLFVVVFGVFCSAFTPLQPQTRQRRLVQHTKRRESWRKSTRSSMRPYQRCAPTGCRQTGGALGMYKPETVTRSAFRAAWKQRTSSCRKGRPKIVTPLHAWFVGASLSHHKVVFELPDPV